MSNSLFQSRRLKRFGLQILIRARKITLPFFDGVPLYDVMRFFWRSIAKGSITNRASGIAFSFFIALFPTLIFLFSLIPFFKIPYFQDENELLLFIKEFVSNETIYGTIETTIRGIFEKRLGLSSFSFFTSLYFATNGLAAMMVAFDSTVHSFKSRTWLGQRLTSLLLLFILTILLTATIILFAGGQHLLNYLKDNNILQEGLTFYLLIAIKWIIIIALFFFAYSFLYYMAPAKKTQWRFISAGGTLATILSIALFAGFGYYINNFSQYNKLYGSIGTLLIILLLIYFFSLILLLGFELNASIQAAHGKKLRL
ncbi:MAG: YihY/virulence factor BrkB family protein [Prolixibacteraceae bacterium]|nr:YihY/virulence factor BrkB family protein [Prolixibacteraceae bacterium]MBN2775090.1 YihY/virulence factor BrkB family protein [Prolixibacteraceae bacterium]